MLVLALVVGLVVGIAWAVTRRSWRDHKAAKVAMRGLSQQRWSNAGWALLAGVALAAFLAMVANGR